MSTKHFTIALRLAAVAATLGFMSPAGADPNPGAYLAARQAGQDGDFASATRYFRAALLADPGNTALMDQTITSMLGTGQIEPAAEIAAMFINAGGESQFANIATMAQAARTENWDAIFEMLEAGHEVGPLLDGLAQAWAYIGKGETERAMMSFDEVAATGALRAFGLHHKAMALALLGDLEAADEIYMLPPQQGIPPSRLTVVAHVEILCRMGEFERAEGIVERAFGSTPDPEITAIREAIAARTVPEVATVTSATDGIATAFLGLTDVLQGEANESYLLLYAQSAAYIAPQNADAHIATARLLNALGQHDAAAQTYARVATNDIRFFTAETGRAEALRSAGRFESAIEVLTQLTRSHPELPLSLASLGDLHRQQDNHARAVAAYSDALDIYPQEAPILWWLLYARGMSNERLDLWDDAEADFRAALALNPGNPSILNYLGYSLVDRGLKFNEALGMIETAVAERPDSGAITDSLAWVYYKLGRYQDAVDPMERAAELEPNDPIISDHLGDVYWMVGRKNEARFQWRRALSFEPEDDEATRIRRKLNIGLDAVYAEDGETPAPAVEVANDGN